jgi:transposase
MRQFDGTTSVAQHRTGVLPRFRCSPMHDAARHVTALRDFVAGIVGDIKAVRAAMSQPWSNGPVEGQVNRLKMLKRQMYGRAKFDLLRRRVLHAA